MAGDEREIIIEFHQVGNSVRVSAFDIERMVEVTIVGDPAVGEAALQQAVLRKLDYVLAKRDRSTKPGAGRDK